MKFCTLIVIVLLFFGCQVRDAEAPLPGKADTTPGYDTVMYELKKIKESPI